jgi:hypothetical protein
VACSLIQSCFDRFMQDRVKVRHEV